METELAIGGEYWLFNTPLMTPSVDTVPKKFVYGGRFSIDEGNYLLFVSLEDQEEIKVSYIDNYPDPILDTYTFVVATSKASIFNKIRNAAIELNQEKLLNYYNHQYTKHPEWFI
jgi:hypothetical protein